MVHAFFSQYFNEGEGMNCVAALGKNSVAEHSLHLFFLSGSPSFVWFQQITEHKTPRENTSPPRGTIRSVPLLSKGHVGNSHLFKNFSLPTCFKDGHSDVKMNDNKVETENPN